MFLVGRISHYLNIIKHETGNVVSGLFFFVFFRYYLSVFLVLNFSLWFSAFYIKKLIDEPRIALHYNVDSGIDFYGSDYQIFILPILGLFIFLTNISIFAIVRNQQDRKFIGHILCSVGILSNLILLVGVFSIYLINFK